MRKRAKRLAEKKVLKRTATVMLRLGLRVLIGLAFIGGCALAGCSARSIELSTSSYPATPGVGLASVRAAVEGRVKDGRYPGVVYTIACGDRILRLEAVGASDVDTKTKMRTDSIFRLMSMTKPVTAVAAMTLVDEGKLDLDAPISRYLPEFVAFGVPGAKPLTLRHLLTHTSGIGFGSIPTTPTTLAAHVRDVAVRQMTVPAGVLWAYSAFDGPDVVARVIEVVANESYERYIQRRIFNPLGMKDTSYTLTADQRSRLVGLSAIVNNQITASRPLFPDVNYPSGGAGLYSTASDYLRFTQMLANGGSLGGIRILSPTSINELRREQLAPGFPGLQPGVAWGLLMRHIDDPVAAKSSLPAGSYGWSGAYGTHFWVDPNSGLTAVWMINLTTAGGASSPDAVEFEDMVMRACATDSECSCR